MDGEDPGLDPVRIDSHLTGCSGCAGWLERAEWVTRAVRTAPVEAPDLTAAVLAAVGNHRAGWSPGRNLLRGAVAVVAGAQLVLALPVLIAADLHIGREIAAFEVALAVGFGLAAWRPDWARALVPVAVALAAGLALTSAVDVVGAQASPVHEVGHLAAVVQAALLWALARVSVPGRPRGGARAMVTAA